MGRTFESCRVVPMSSSFSRAGNPQELLLFEEFSCSIESWRCYSFVTGIGQMKKARQNEVWRQRPWLASFALAGVWFFLTSPGTAATAEAPPRASSTPLLAHFAIADFDGDSKPDLASVEAGPGDAKDTHYRIALEMSSGARQIIGVTAPAGGLQVASRDVNGDSFLDVVVTTSWANRPVAVLLNDGLGNFIRSDPSIFPAAFPTSENTWTRTRGKILSSCAILLSRNSLRYGEEYRRKPPQEDETALLAPWVSFAVTGPFPAFSSGRAPPCCLPLR